MATVSILGMAITSIVIFEMLKDWLLLDLSPDTSNESAASRFGDLKGNWSLFFAIIPLIWLESFLEEVLDRGFFDELDRKNVFKHSHSHRSRGNTSGSYFRIQALQ